MRERKADLPAYLQLSKHCQSAEQSRDGFSSPPGG
jgi:hypothetical protein